MPLTCALDDAVATGVKDGVAAVAGDVDADVDLDEAVTMDAHVEVAVCRLHGLLRRD